MSITVTITITEEPSNPGAVGARVITTFDSGDAGTTPPCEGAMWMSITDHLNAFAHENGAPLADVRQSNLN